MKIDGFVHKFAPLFINLNLYFFMRPGQLFGQYVLAAVRASRRKVASQVASLATLSGPDTDRLEGIYKRAELNNSLLAGIEVADLRGDKERFADSFAEVGMGEVLKESIADFSVTAEGLVNGLRKM